MPRGMSLAKLQAIGAVQSKAEKSLAQPSLQAVSVRWDHRKQTRVLLDKKGTSWKDLYLSHVFLSCLRYLCIQQWTDCIPCTNADQLLKSCKWLWAVPVPLQGIYQPNDRNKVQESCYLYSLSEKKVLAAWWCLQTAIFSLKKKKKKHKKLPNGEEQCCKRQKQRDCWSCNISKHIHVNLTEKKTSLRNGIFLPQQRRHTTTQETTNFILKCAGWTQHIFRRTAAFPPHAGKPDCIIAPHRASHLLQSFLECNKEIRGNMLATENCQLLEIINPFKCLRNILSQSCEVGTAHTEEKYHRHWHESMKQQPVLMRCLVWVFFTGPSTTSISLKSLGKTMAWARGSRRREVAHQ